MSIESRNPKVNPVWLKTNQTEAGVYKEHFIRRTDVIELGESHCVQSALIVPTGYGKESNYVFLGYGTGNTSVKRLFPESPRLKGYDFNLVMKIESQPKEGKLRSGDMPAILLSMEKDHGVINLTAICILVDNLTTSSTDTYGIGNLSADSYAAGEQRNSLIQKLHSIHEYVESISNMSIKSGGYGSLFVNKRIPAGVMNFRNKTLGLFADGLPEADPYSEKFRGIYAVSVSRICFDPEVGFKGNTHIIRSLADIEVRSYKGKSLITDAHLPAQMVAEKLSSNTAEIYNAKLRARIYDTVGAGFTENVGSFEVARFSANHPKRKLYGKGDISLTHEIKSDGHKVGFQKDDVSRIFLWIGGSKLN